MTEVALALAIGSIIAHCLGIWWLGAPLAFAAYQTFAEEKEEDDAIEAIEVEDEMARRLKASIQQDQEGNTIPWEEVKRRLGL